jgi:type I restriction enzyme S subunit
MTTSAVETTNVERAEALRRFKPYPAYKDSGVEWLGEIPAGWEVKKNGALFIERNERGRDDLPILEVSIASGVRIRHFSDTKIEQRSDDLAAYKVARAGDIAFNKMRMWQGAVGATPEDGLVSPDYIVARPRIDTVPDYYAAVYRTSLYMAEVYRWSRGIVDDRNRLYWGDFKAIPTPRPPPDEQRAIVAFLDQETTRLDALIAKVRDAIDRVKELRTALISAAVTGKIDVREEVTI